MTKVLGLPLRWLAGSLSVTVAAGVALMAPGVAREPAAAPRSTAAETRTEVHDKVPPPTTTSTPAAALLDAVESAQLAGWCESLDRPIAPPGAEGPTFVSPGRTWAVVVPPGWQSSTAGERAAFFPPSPGVSVAAYPLSATATDLSATFALARESLFDQRPAMLLDTSGRLDLGGLPACHVRAKDVDRVGALVAVDLWLVVVGDEVVAFERRGAEGADLAALAAAEGLVASVSQR